MRRHHKNPSSGHTYTITVSAFCPGVTTYTPSSWSHVSVNSPSDIHVGDIVKYHALGSLSRDNYAPAVLKYTTSSGTSGYVMTTDCVCFTRTADITKYNDIDCSSIQYIPTGTNKYVYIHNTNVLNDIRNQWSVYVDANYYRICGADDINELGVVSGGGTFNVGATTTITAADSTKYVFDCWSDGNTNRSRTITVSSNATYAAVYKPKELTITANVASGSTGMGTVTGSCTIAYGHYVYISASPNSGYAFNGWTGSSTSTTNPLYVKPTSNITYSAKFVSTIVNYNVTFGITSSSYGTMKITYGGNTYTTTSTLTKTITSGTSVTLDFIPGTAPTGKAYVFDGWDTAPSGAPTSLPATITVTGNATYKMKAKLINCYPICAYPNDTNQCTATVNGYAGCLMVNENTLVTVTATPKSGYTFIRWSDNVTSPTRMISATENTTLTAFCTKGEYASDMVFHARLTDNTLNDDCSTAVGSPVGTNSSATYNTTEKGYQLSVNAGSSIGNITTFNARCGLRYSNDDLSTFFSNTISRTGNGYTVAVYAKLISQSGNGYSQYISASSQLYSNDSSGTTKQSVAAYCPVRNGGNTSDSGWHWYVCTLKGTTACFYRDGVKSRDDITNWAHTSSDYPIDVALCDLTKNNTSFSIYVRDARVYKRVLTQTEISTFAVPAPTVNL